MNLASATTGLTPLMRAAAKLHVMACSMLLANGADVNAVDTEGKCALHHVLEAELAQVRH